MRSLRGFAFVAVSLAFSAFGSDAVARGNAAGKPVTFMTRNLYLGAELDPAIVALLGGDPAEIVTAVGTVWTHVVGTDFPTRAVALADEVKKEKPDFLGLQEVATWSVGPPLDPADADDVVYDYLATFQSALRARGLHYDVVAVAEGFTAEAPAFVADSPYEIPGFPFPVPGYDIRLHLRDVLLVKHGGEAKISNAAGHAFAVNTVFDTPLGPIVSTYGWVQADVTMGKREFRIVSTHLDDVVPQIRALQAQEVLNGPCATTGDVVVIGDLNSDGNGAADEEAYLMFRAADFADAWLEANPDDPGITWGHDQDLVDPDPAFPVRPGSPERIDFVLYRADFTVEAADLVGEDPDDMYGGLWPSDHAGLVVTLRVR
jgi:endonuclease/exonuclease/phosphatase family metal-dependent hydrolase